MDVKRLRALYDEIEYHLNTAPIEDDCSKEENEMYADMANLKNSLVNLDIDKVPSTPVRMFERTKAKHDDERRRTLLKYSAKVMSIEELDVRMFKLIYNGDGDFRYVSIYNDSFGQPTSDDDIKKIVDQSQSFEDFCDKSLEQDLPVDFYESLDMNYL